MRLFGVGICDFSEWGMRLFRVGYKTQYDMRLDILTSSISEYILVEGGDFMNREELDNQITGQMTIDDFYESGKPEKLFAVSRIFARAAKEMNLAERKAFTFALSCIRFKEKAKGNVVCVNKKDLARAVGINSDFDHRSRNLFRAIGDMPKHSQIKIAKEDKEKYHYKSGVIVTDVDIDESSVVKIEIKDNYINLFSDLMNESEENAGYLTMWADDIFQMKSERSIIFYEKLREETDTRVEVNQYAFGVKALKEMFDIPMDGRGAYMRGKNGFDRSNFEKKVIDPLCEDLRNCKMITLLMQPDGKFYEKVKRGNRVDGYRFFWTFTSHPAVATAAEVKQIQERVDANPEVLKVAKDVLKGEKKQKTKGNSFNNFPQREYDYDSLAHRLEQAQRAAWEKKDGEQ